MNEPGRRLRVFLTLAAGIGAISWAAIFVRFCQAPSLVIAFYRLALAVLVLSLLGRSGGIWRNLPPTPKAQLFIGLSGIFLGLHFYTWVEAVQRIPVAYALTLSSTHPLFVGLLCWLLLGETPAKGLLLGGLLVLLGMVGMSRPDAGSARDLIGGGPFLALAAAFFFAGYLTVGRMLREKTDFLAYVVFTYATAALFLGLLVLAMGLPLLGYNLRTYLMFLLLALVPTGLGHTSINWAIRYLSATFVALTVLGEPIGATLLAIPLLGEIPPPLKILSGSAILTGIYMAARGEVTRS
jgi:drug/metabolite transporter (DMT)-like permease